MKERSLTILVPIKSTDVTATYQNLASLVNAVPPSAAVVNNIYSVGAPVFGYVRAWLNPSTSQYEYKKVVDREFPEIGKPLEIFDFTYDSVRMEGIPIISAQNVMWYAEKDQQGNDVTLENLWTLDCHVTFSGENFYLKRIPTSGKSNEDARYKYDIDFVSERVVLEQVYLYDVVTPYITEKPISESYIFNFFGDIEEFIKRINASLLRSSLSSLVTRATPLTYAEWNNLAFTAPNVHPYSTYNGNYQLYLQGEILIYEDDGSIKTNGYKVVIDDDHEDNENYGKEILLTFDKNTIQEALKKIRDDFGLLYYFKKDNNGNNIIHVGEYDHDFGESNPFEYGRDNELLQIEKSNTGADIITTITGVGGETNIPWYYPNPTPDGWLGADYVRNDQVISGGVVVPDDEQNILYESFLKNRVGVDFTFGRNNTPYAPSVYKGHYSTEGIIRTGYPGLYIEYDLGELGPDDSFDINIQFGDLMPSPSAYIKQCYFMHDTVSGHFVYRPPEYPQEGSYIIWRNDIVDGETIECNWSNLRLLLRDFNYSTKSDHPWPRGHYYLAIEMELPERYSEINDTWYYYPTRTATIHPRGLWGGLDFYENVPFLQSIEIRIPAFFCKKRLAFYWEDPYDEEDGYYEYEGRKFSQTEDFEEILLCQSGMTECQKTYIAKNGGDFGNNTLFSYTKDVFRSEYLAHCPRWVWRLWETKYGEKPLASKEIDWYDFKGSSTAQNLTPLQILDAHPNLILPSYSTTTHTWLRRNKETALAAYGVRLGDNITPQIGDIIRFRTVKYLTPQKNLMPQVYYRTDGERRFYNAHNYDPVRGQETDVDSAIGEVWRDAYVILPDTEVPAGIINPLYYNPDDDNNHYIFENENEVLLPHESVKDFEDVFPTIKEQTNSSGRRIDVVEVFAYDDLDDDTIWVDESNEAVSGEYKHPHFFAKLRPLGFNLFDQALQEDMVMSLTSGHCGGCDFKIKVDEKTKKNPVQVWRYDMGTFPEGATHTDANFVRLYAQGDLMRYGVYSDCYYKLDTNSYEPVSAFNRAGGFMSGMLVNNRNTFNDIDFDAEDLENGLVGNTKRQSSIHFEGDVVTRGRFIDSQQDTTSNYVWVALEKNTEAYGTLMPSAMRNYSDDNLSVYIRPSSVADCHTSTSTPAEDEENADKFVFLNIRMPQIYIRRAEEKLSKELIKCMYESNYQKFSFDIKISRIFLAQNPNVLDNLNEASLLYVKYNNTSHKQYVFSYTYKVTKNELPEVTVSLNDDRNLVSKIRSSSGRYSSQPVFAARILDENNPKGDNIQPVSSNTSNYETSTRETIDALRREVAALTASLNRDYYKKTDIEIKDGRNLRIGDMMMTAAYIEDNSVKRDTVDSVAKKFVPASNDALKPALISGRTVQNKKTTYTAVIAHPADWETNYANYYKLVGTEYVPVTSVEQHAPDFYIQTVYKGTYTAMNVQPSDWDTNWEDFYYKDHDIYVSLKGLSKPTFIGGKYYRLIYTVQEGLPTDWSTNWGSYYYKIGTTDTYQHVPGAVYPIFAANVYYTKAVSSDSTLVPVEVTGATGAVNTIASSTEYGNIIGGLDQLERAGCDSISDKRLPSVRTNPTDSIPERCEEKNSTLWFRSPFYANEE